MKRHPWGKVPAITLPDGFTVYESRAICSFLAKNYSLQLLPLESDLKAMALFEQAQSVEIFYFAEPAGRIIFEKHVKPIKGLLADEVVILEALRMLEQFFNIAERLLQSQCYMAGNDFTLVDIYYIPLILRLFSYDFGSLVTNRKTVSDWWDRCITRPGIKEILDADKKAAAVHGK